MALSAENKVKVHGLVLFILAVFFTVAYLIPLGARPMLRPDEYRYAEIPREMIVSGNWITPKIADISYFEKPALGYQLTALSFSILGENSFALRLPSALAVLLCAAFLYFYLGRMKPEEPLLPGFAAGIYMTFGIVYGIGTYAVLDSQLCCALTVCIGCFHLACASPSKKSVFVWLSAAGIAAGTAFLLKGLLGFAIPAIVAAPCLVWKKEWKKLFLYPWIPFAAALLTALPWSLAIHTQSPGFWPYFLKVEHWMRFTGSTFDRNPEPFWYFLPVLLGGMLPSGLFLAASSGGFRKTFFKEDFTLFHLSWFAIPFVFFSISSCKLGTYILPCFPPLAVLIASVFLRAARNDAERTEKYLRKTILISGYFFLCASVAALPIATIVCHREYFALAAAGTALFLFAVWGTSLVILSKKQKIRPAALSALFLFGWAPAVCTGLFAIPDSAFGNKATERCIHEALEQVPLRPGDILLVDRATIHPVAWTLKRTDLTLVGRPGELYYPLTEFAREFPGRWIKDESLKELLEQTPAGKRVFIGMRKLKKKPFPANWKIQKQADASGIVIARF